VSDGDRGVLARAVPVVRTTVIKQKEIELPSLDHPHGDRDYFYHRREPAAAAQSRSRTPRLPGDLETS
jgi:hypothetical protein